MYPNNRKNNYVPKDQQQYVPRDQQNQPQNQQRNQNREQNQWEDVNDFNQYQNKPYQSGTYTPDQPAVYNPDYQYQPRQQQQQYNQQYQERPQNQQQGKQQDYYQDQRPQQSQNSQRNKPQQQQQNSQYQNNRQQNNQYNNQNNNRQNQQNNRRGEQRNQQQNVYREEDNSHEEENEDEIKQQGSTNPNPEVRPERIEKEGLNYLEKQRRRQQIQQQEEEERREQKRFKDSKHNRYINKKDIQQCLDSRNPAQSLEDHFKRYYPKSGQITSAIDNIQIERFRNFIETMHYMVDALLVSANYIPYVEEIFLSKVYIAQLIVSFNNLSQQIYNTNMNVQQTNQVIYTFKPFVEMCIKFLQFSSKSLNCPLCSLQIQSIFTLIERAKNPKLKPIVDEYAKFKLILEDAQQKYIEAQKKQNNSQKGLDPEANYDLCPPFPVQEELLQNENVPFFGQIMPVKQQDPYKSTESYLNNNFYILREDYMRDFRTAIMKLREQSFENLDRDVLNSVFIYTDLNLENVSASNNGVIYSISLIPYDQRNRKIDWLKSKRLMTGSLLAFTRDDFSMFVFASVIYKDSIKAQREYAKTGRVRIQVKLFGEDLTECIQDLNKLMMSQRQIYAIENKIFFETYIHYLRCIQEIDTSVFPFREQLVYSQKGSPIPKYFGNARQVMYGINLKYDLNKPTLYEYRNQIDILRPWNDNIKESLDDSQFRAIQLMVKSGLAIVQGPPGTGKTYCGALAVRILLNNQDKWNPQQQNQQFFQNTRQGQMYPEMPITNKPILIVCNTNHALDQFLNHILSFSKPDDIVRIGGRCKDERIKPLVLQKAEKVRFEFGQFKFIKEQTQKYVTDMLNSSDNVAYVDFVDHQQNLVDIIINQYCLKEDAAYMNPLQLESKRLIFYLWMDNKKPREEDFLKIQQIEQNAKNKLIRQVVQARKQQWRAQMVIRQPINLDIGLSQDQILRMMRYEDDGVDENNQLNSDDENDRKEYNQQGNEEGQQAGQVNQARQCLKKLGLDQKKLDAIQQKLNLGICPWDLNSNERFVLVTSVFVKKYQKVFTKAADKLQEYDDLQKKLQATFLEADMKLIQSKKIIGATVSGCAKYASKFDKLNFSIMIIEEAAEVLESHTIAILKKSVEHLILIGDHLQLKPKLQSYYLETRYQPNISLFERLVNNDVDYVTLTNQRRMKTVFADFIRLIYKDYKDHPDILKHQNQQKIQGLEKDLVFFDHRSDENNDSATQSKCNRLEAEMIIKMAIYLIKNGYKPQDITILALYVKQALLIKKHADSERILGMKIITVDNYQGEENQFVFLSLVRSNKKKSLGFVSIDNRVCVALSRARIGLFVFGNFKFIKDVIFEKIREGRDPNITDLWLRIIDLANTKGVLNDYIGLQCFSHQKKVQIRTVEDWRKVSGGGCDQDCNIKFNCGHVCKEKCHQYEHIRENCKNECEVRLPCGHKCKSMCKKLDCPPCMEKIPIQLKCKHFQEVLCSEQNVKCFQKCGRTLICGHKCQLDCSMPCDQQQCQDFKDFKVPKCGHTIKIKCGSQPNAGVICNNDCDELLPCGDKCRGTCGGCLRGTFHRPCEKKCKRVLRCGHECERKCGQPCTRCNKICTYQCCVAKCQLKCGEVCVDCLNKCVYRCEHTKCTKKCSQDCDREPCNLNCNIKLDCGCDCSGLCGEKCPQICKLHNPDGYTIFFGEEDEDDAKFYALECPSSHIFEVSGLDGYFKSKSDELEQQGGQLTQLKCPKCNLIISQSSRYQRNIKSVLRNFNEIKKKENQYILVTVDEIDELRDKIRKLLQENNNKDPNSFLTETLKFLDIQIKKLDKGQSAEIIKHEYNCIKNQLDFYSHGVFLQSKQVTHEEFNIHREIILKDYLYNHNLFYIANDEFWNRLAYKLETMKLYLQILLEYPNNDKKQNLAKMLHYIEDNSFLIDEYEIKNFQQELQSLSKLSLDQIRSITRAVMDAGQGQGHWFKCPNGHFFAIGDCGGAMQVSKCADCGAQIGGQQHQLLQNNQLASEIDGARENAYQRLQRQFGNT